MLTAHAGSTVGRSSTGIGATASGREALFDLLRRRRVLRAPIALRHPIVFYEGHLPAFSFNTLVKKALGGAEHRRAARNAVRARHRSRTRPHRGELRRRHARVAGRRATRSARSRTKPTAACSTRSQHADLDRPGHPLLDRAEAVFAILEHEAMHQETLLYMWHRLPFEQKRRPAGLSRRASTDASPRAGVDRRSRPAARRSASIAARFRSAGTTSSRRCASTCRRSRSSATT